MDYIAVYWHHSGSGIPVINHLFTIYGHRNVPGKQGHLISTGLMGRALCRYYVWKGRPVFSTQR